MPLNPEVISSYAGGVLMLEFSLEDAVSSITVLSLLVVAALLLFSLLVAVPLLVVAALFLLSLWLSLSFKSPFRMLSSCLLCKILVAVPGATTWLLNVLR